MGSGRGWLAGDWPSTEGRSQHYCGGLDCGLPLMAFWQHITRSQNVSECFVLAVCLVVFVFLHYIYIFWALAPKEFCQVQNHFASKSCALLYWQRYCTALQQRASGKLCGVVQGMELRNFHRGRHLYSTGRPSRWASAHILGCTNR